MQQDVQLSQRDRAAGELVLAKVEDWDWETIFYGHCGSIFNHCNIMVCKAIEFGKKTQYKGY